MEGGCSAAGGEAGGGGAEGAVSYSGTAIAEVSYSSAGFEAEVEIINLEASFALPDAEPDREIEPDDILVLEGMIPATDVDEASPLAESVPEIDPLLIETINEIGAKVLAEVSGATDTPLAEDSSSDLSESDSEPEQPAEADGQAAEATTAIFNSDVGLPEAEAAEAAEPLSSEALAQEFHPFIGGSAQLEVVDDAEDDELSGANEPASETVLQEIDQAEGSSEEIFSGLVTERGMSLDNASAMQVEGMEEGRPYTDTIRYTETAAGVTLVQHTRAFESGEVNSEVTAIHSLERFFRMRGIKPRESQPVLEVEQVTDKSLHNLKWHDETSGPTEFPQDIAVSLRDRFQGSSWQTEHHSDNPIIVKGKSEEKSLGEDEAVLSQVQGALNAVRPKSLQPRVKRTNVLHAREQ